MRYLVWILLAIVAVVILGMGLQVFALVALALFIGGNWTLCRYWSRNIWATREVSHEEAEIGERVEVSICLENRGRLPIIWTVVEELLSPHALLPPPGKLEVEGRRVHLVTLPGRGKMRIGYRLKCRGRGFFQLGPLVIEVGDLFGLFRRYRVLTAPRFLTVFPPLLPIEGYDIASRRPIGEIRLTHRLYEDPTRIVGVREYRQGDSLRQIHWKATARTGPLQSKVYEPSYIAGATLAVDFHRHSYPDIARAELAITCAASLAAAICAQRQQVGLVSNGRDAAERIRTEGREIEYRSRRDARQASQMSSVSDRLFPVIIRTTRGDLQLYRILETLARLEPGEGLSMGQALLEVAPWLPRDATVVVILPGAEDSTLGVLVALRQHGFPVTVILNTYEPHDYAVAAERFLSYGIEARHLRDESSITQLCQPYILP
jgi:uncharacterized protein (DUF58 family)